MWGQTPSGFPVRFGTVQGISVDFAYSQKELYGQNVFPEKVANGSAKITGKIKAAKVDGNLWNALFFNGTSSVGSLAIADAEAHSVPATTAYTVTVTNSTKFVQDLGVRYAATGYPLQQVASGPTLGQYSVSAGVYTFAAADASAAILIDYTYTLTTGAQYTVSNALQGTTPTFQLIGMQGLSGQYDNMLLYACVASKLSMASKMGDWNVPEIDFSAFANPAGDVVQWNFPNQVAGA
ncbi:MAG: hypothetical protein KGI82_00375 [Betaproteobacteria bacterium]|nr:hypothetical protein [Betaproteobacteria bacterium]